MSEMLIKRRDGSEHVVLYDAADADLIESRTWHIKESTRVSGLFYARTCLGQSTLKMHALLLGRPWVDHINHNGLDNRRSNLRAATPGQNAANRRPQGNGTSRYKGVGWHLSTGQWRARIAVDGRRHELGYFADESDAAMAYDRAAREMFGEFAYLNFPDQAAS